MKKIFTLAFLGMLAALTFTACGGSDDEEDVKQRGISLSGNNYYESVSYPLSDSYKTDSTELVDFKTYVSKPSLIKYTATQTERDTAVIYGYALISEYKLSFTDDKNCTLSYSKKIYYKNRDCVKKMYVCTFEKTPYRISSPAGVESLSENMFTYFGHTFNLIGYTYSTTIFDFKNEGTAATREEDKKILNLTYKIDEGRNITFTDTTAGDVYNGILSGNTIEVDFKIKAKGNNNLTKA